MHACTCGQISGEFCLILRASAHLGSFPKFNEQPERKWAVSLSQTPSTNAKRHMNQIAKQRAHDCAVSNLTNCLPDFHNDFWPRLHAFRVAGILDGGPMTRGQRLTDTGVTRLPVGG
jgi:hypothetical protein